MLAGMQNEDDVQWHTELRCAGQQAAPVIMAWLAAEWPDVTTPSVGTWAPGAMITATPTPISDAGTVSPVGSAQAILELYPHEVSKCEGASTTKRHHSGLAMNLQVVV